MRMRDHNVDNTSHFPLEHTVIPLAPAVSQTDQPQYLRQFGARRRIDASHLFCAAKTDTTTIKLVVANDNAIFVGSALAIATTNTKIKTTGQISFLNAGVATIKAATDNITLAAGTINTAGAAGRFWGTQMLQLKLSDGSLSFKVPSADQVFATEAAAIAGRAAPDAGNVEVGYATVRSATDTALTFVTQDLSAGTITVNYTALTTLYPAAAASVAPTAMKSVASTLRADLTNVDILENQFLIVTATTDGSGALTHGRLTLRHRSLLLRGDVAAGSNAQT